MLLRYMKICRAICPLGIPNRKWATEIVTGDVNKGFEEADVVVEEAYA